MKPQQSENERDRHEIISGGTRREVLARFAALTMAGFVGGPIASSRAATTSELSDAHVATFRALASTYSQFATKVGVPSRSDLLGDLRKKLAASDPKLLRHVKATLEALEVAPRGGRFSDLSVADRRASLKSWRVRPIPFDRQVEAAPRDPDALSDLRKDNERVAANIRAFQDTLPPEQRRLDPDTMLPAYTPPAPTDGQFAGSGEGPLVTENQQLQYLAGSAFSMIASLHVDDPRSLDDTVL